MVPEHDPRVFFAAERTFLAWIRTGLALMGFGFVVARFGIFLREVAVAQGASLPVGGASRWFGIGLLALGAAITAGSTATYVLTIRRLIRGEPYVGRPTWLGIATATLLAIAGGLMALYLLFSA